MSALGLQLIEKDDKIRMLIASKRSASSREQVDSNPNVNMDELLDELTETRKNQVDLLNQITALVDDGTRDHLEAKVKELEEARHGDQKQVDSLMERMGLLERSLQSRKLRSNTSDDHGRNLFYIYCY